jgi:hypothetical protein
MKFPATSRFSSLLCCFLSLLLILCRCASAQEQQKRLLLSGNVVTPDGVLAHAWLDIQKGVIVHITNAKPALADVDTIDTNDLIFPGFIDLHNHPAYNVLPRWTPPVKFHNRYAWRDWDDYKKALADPAHDLFDKDTYYCEIDEYAEIKALIGGTTSMIGFSSLGRTKPYPACIQGLVRNLDVATGFYSKDPGHERIVNSIGILPRDMNAGYAAHIAGEIQSGAIDLLAIHIAEGLPTDSESEQELDLLDAHGLLGPHTALIHAVGLSPTQLARVHAAGASIVWSPRSNFELYGATADIDAAFRAGVTISLAPDWSPSGSDNMWDEIRYARKVSAEQFSGLISDRQLVEMASSIPARVARIDDKVGTLAPGMYADLFLVHTDDPNALKNPYSAIASGTIDKIDLVVINGLPVYGETTQLKQVTANTEPLTVCGSQKALNLDALPAGSFIAVKTRLSAKLKALGTDLAPIAECEP